MHVINHASDLFHLAGLVLMLFLQVYPAHSQDFSYKEQKELSGFDDYVLMSGFSPFRNYFAVTVGDNHILIYNKNWDLTYEHKGNPESRAGVFAFSPDEQFMVFTKYKYENDIAVVRLDDMKVTQVLTEPKGWINDVKLSADGQWLAACCQDKFIHVWRWNGKMYDYKFKVTDHTRETSAVAFNTGGTLMATGGNDYKINLYRISDEACRLLQTFPLEEYYSDIAFHPNKELFVVGGRQRLRFYHKQGNEFRIKEELDVDVNHRISFSPDGKFLAVGISNTLHIFQEKDGSFVEADMIYRHYQ